MAWNVSEALKGFLDEGYAPVVFVGTYEALPIFNSNAQVWNRMLPPIDLAPLDPTIDADRRLFCGYCGRLDKRVVQYGCVSKPTGLMKQHILSGLHYVSGGIVGTVNNLLSHAIGET
jgi:hypothetical protein